MCEKRNFFISSLSWSSLTVLTSCPVDWCCCCSIRTPKIEFMKKLIQKIFSERIMDSEMNDETMQVDFLFFFFLEGIEMI